MEFWSKGLGKRTIAMGLSGGESLLSMEALCLRGTMKEPVSWEYVMLLEEPDVGDFFALLREPELARFIHASPDRWRLYAGFVVGAAQVAWLVLKAAVRRRSGRIGSGERPAIQLPPPYVIEKRKKRTAYRRRLSTTAVETPAMRGVPATDESGTLQRAGGA
jgi:hypothetical protein